MMAISACTLIAMGLNKLPVRNAENGDSITTTIPNGMTIEVEEPTIGKSFLDKAIQYESDGRIFEALSALYHAWIMGDTEEVDRHLHEDESAKGTMALVNFIVSGLTDSCMYKQLKEVKGREAEDLCLMYEATNNRNSITEKMMFQLMDSPIINFMTSKLHKNVMGDTLTRDGIYDNLQKALDDGFLFAYGKMAEMAFEDGNYEESLFLYEKAFEAGCLCKDDIAVISQLSENNSDVFVKPDMKIAMERMKFISYKYWQKLMANR